MYALNSRAGGRHETTRVQDDVRGDVSGSTLLEISRYSSFMDAYDSLTPCTFLRKSYAIHDSYARISY